MQLTPPAGSPPEPGGPLIPREILPAPVRPARAHRPPAPSVRPADPGRRQLSLFGVEAAEPAPDDLAGLLAGPARLVRMGGTGRVSVRVDAAWRVHVLIAELSARGLEVSWASVTGDPVGPPASKLPAGDAQQGDAQESDAPAGEVPLGDAQVGEVPVGGVQVGGAPVGEAQGADRGQDGGTGTGGSPGPGVARFEVRTAYSSLLAGLARTWLVGTAKRVPDRFLLTGPRLRLWAAAAGAPDRGGYVLCLDPDGGPDGWATVDAALARAGLAGAPTDGPRYRISDRRRLARLAELVGEPPAAVPPGLWPGA